MSNQEYHLLRSACAGDKDALSIVEKLWSRELGRRDGVRYRRAVMKDAKKAYVLR
jgi:hypothetical protein